MSFRDNFPVAAWIGRALTGRAARRFFLSLLLLLLLGGVGLRLYSYVLTRRMEAVITGLGKLEIDKSSEADIVRLAPGLVRWERREVPVVRSLETGDIDLGTGSNYYVTISNEDFWLKYREYIYSVRFCSSDAKVTPEEGETGCVYPLAELLGYRYMDFGASVHLLNGRVTAIGYGVADRFTGPRVIGEILSVKSVHSFWRSRRTGFEVRSTDDESPQYRVEGNEHGLSVTYTYDAPRALMARAFQANLNCLWGLRGCRHVKQVAPLLWQDRNRILEATLARLQSAAPCPDRILAGRMRYLPDAIVMVLESRGFGPENVMQGDQVAQGIVTQYESVEAIRGEISKEIQPVWAEDTVPFPTDYERRLPNKGLRWAVPGERVLAFSNMRFDSCAMVPATPSAMAAVHGIGVAPRRWEDELVFGLQ